VLRSAVRVGAARCGQRTTSFFGSGALSWIAPPPKGIDDKPLDYEYVKLGT
jgi:hypothetical protein